MGKMCEEELGIDMDNWVVDNDENLDDLLSKLSQESLFSLGPSSKKW